MDKTLSERELFVLQTVLTRAICIIERVKQGKLYACTKNVNLIKILIETVYNKRSRKTTLTAAQVKALAKSKSPLCFDINTFGLISLTPNQYRLRSAEIIDSDTTLECINTLIKSKALTKIELKDELKKLNSNG